MRSQRERLLDILNAIEAIEEHADRGQDAYVHDKLIQGWMILQLQRIGEAAARLADTISEQCPEIPWQDIVGMRNILTHEYFGISLTRVWMTVVNDVPVPKECVTRVLAELKE